MFTPLPYGIRSFVLVLLAALPVFAGERVPVIVILRAGVASATAEIHGLDVTTRWQHVGAIAGEADGDDLPKIAKDPAVLRIDVDPGGSGDLAESVPLIGGDIVRKMGYIGSGVTVAIVDSGVSASHPDVAGRIVAEQCYCRNSDGTGCCPNGQVSQSGPGAAADDNGHGTNVTGIVASKGVVSSPGVASGVQIVAVKVLDRANRFSSTAQIISALDWIIDQHPEVRVINMSLGTDLAFPSYCDGEAAFTMAFADAIRTLRNRGTLVFVSSGNNASATSMQVPACIESATSVGAVYDANLGAFGTSTCSVADAKVDEVACFSNSNSTLDLLAPGARITSDGLNGGLSTFVGTSQASPHAAGSAAVLFGIKPSSTADEIEALLKTTGKPILDPRNGVVTPRVNLLDAAIVVLRVSPLPKRHRSVGH